uniref:tRNA splicing endonuclease subunit 54 n=1 Tax=Coturnix japonica TaxID=93934 RepID=A0A8C2SKZ0_COTJA
MSQSLTTHHLSQLFFCSFHVQLHEHRRRPAAPPRRAPAPGSLRPPSRQGAREALIALRRRNRAPRRSCGQKELVPDGSAEQAERLRVCLEEQRQQLAEERVERPGNLVKAVWKPEQGIVELESPAGKFWHTMGFSQCGKQCLLPEEALYLLECGSLQLFYKDMIMSVQEAYEILLSQENIFSNLPCSQSLLVSPCSTVPSPYERQLNLESHCKSSGKHHHKKRRSSKQLKELDTDNGEEQSVTSNSVPLDAGRKNIPSSSWSLVAGDQKASSTGTRVPRWDFTTIFLPNVAPDQPCIHLPSPDSKLLPENVPGREVDAASWCRRINQKQEKLSQKEREQQEKGSKYKSSINADREVRCCINWQEYKALLRWRSQQKVWIRPPHLWDQAVTPLLQPEEATSLAAVRQQISVLQPSHILDGASWLDLESIKIDFNVYQADAVAKFKKTNPGKPYVRMCVQSFDEQIPSLRALKQVTYQSGDVPVVFALVDHGEIAFYSLKEFKLPDDVNY